MHIRICSRLTLVVLLVSLVVSDTFAAPIRVGHVEAELISSARTIAPGEPFTVGLRLKLDDHWHVYWRNPGDAGLPPSVKWDIPEGFIAGPIQWPIPERILTPPLASYAYSHEVILPMQINPPAGLSAGATVTLQGKASWLVCKEECVPGQADLQLTLQVAERSEVDPARAESFASIAYPIKADFAIDVAHTAKQFKLTFAQPPGLLDSTPVEFFAAVKGTIDHFAEQKLTSHGSSRTLTVRASEYLLEQPDSLSGLLKIGSENDARLYEFSAVVTDGSAVAATSAPSTGFWRAILFAFIGGLILNLMPCVLPVLSLKILGFVNHANAEHTRPITHGAIFTAGVLISFWLLAGALLFLKAGGEQLGWGFQLQSPTFLVVITSFIFLFGLNLLGVFEIGATFASASSVASGKTGLAGSFLNGVTATVVATPCTAPFMGSALGYSLAQPAWIALLIFTAIALGMAAPYMLLSAYPRLLKFVPKPGRWMETLKHFLGFVLLATVLWLLWVMSIQIGTTGLIFALAALLLLGLAAWVKGRWDTLTASGRTRSLARVGTIGLVVLALVVGIGGAQFGAPTTPSPSTTSSGITWEPFTPERVEELRIAGTPVFIDFTAAWCLSCQVNEKVAFSSTEVQRRFSDLGIVALKADWTARDQTIAAALARFGRNSVPLYVLYHNGAAEPMLLPEILTPGIVLEALQQINNQPGTRSSSRQVTTRDERHKKESA
ncbi:MAG: thioredoxin family protein [candidate division Zixibacteria bacterium]|nr:thioredoxin family protein [candidate division Zixibacteria bacterium]